LGLENYIFINGYPGKTIFNFVNYENSIAENMRIFWISNLIQDGVLNNGYQILSYAHDDAVVTRIISYYDRVLEDIKHKLGKDIFKKKNKINLNQDLRK